MRPSLRLAVALKYEHHEDVAPLVLAAGRNEAAEALVERARDLDIPVQTDAPLAQALDLVPVGAFVPEELYPVVAQVLALVYTMDRQVGKRESELTESTASGRSAEPVRPTGRVGGNFPSSNDGSEASGLIL